MASLTGELQRREAGRGAKKAPDPLRHGRPARGQPGGNGRVPACERDRPDL